MDVTLMLSYLMLIIGILIYIFKDRLIEGSSNSSVKFENGEILKRLPGPFCLPLIGHVQFLFKKDPQKYLAQLAQRYGDIFQLQIGFKTVVVLNSLNVIKTAFQEREFAVSGHPRFAFINYGNQWKFLRKNAVKGLSIFASSKNSRLQKVVYEAADSFADDVRQNLDRPFNPKKSIGECVAAIIGAINFGGQFDRKNPLIQEMVNFTNVTARFLQTGTILDYFPFGSLLMRSRISDFMKQSLPLFAFSEKHIREHEYNEDVTDVADALYVRRQEITQEELDKSDTTSDCIQMIAQDLFVAGFATTLETLNWCMALMGKYPDIQDRLAQEIQEAMDSNSSDRLSLNDARSTPYTEAFLLEVLRFSSLIPLNLPHYTTSAKSLQGYYIPKDAVIVSNLYSVHYNPKVFKKPNNFEPDRFLSTDGTLDVDMGQNIVPFSVGKRRCIGENLARQELYLLLTSIVHNFKIRSVPGQEIEVHNADSGFSRRVFEHNLIFSLRE